MVADGESGWGKCTMTVSSSDFEHRTRHTRYIDGFVSRHERTLLEDMARRIPAHIVPDHLTAIGLAGALLTAVALVCTRFSPVFALIAIVGLAINWFGDSLDGTLARVRNIERPRYGFFVDHMADLAAQLVIVLGLGLSPAMRLDVAALALIGYLSLSVYSLIKLHVSRAMQLTFFGVGPTEIRLIIASGIAIGALFNLPVFSTPLGHFSVFDVAAIVVAVFAIGSAMAMFVADARRLAHIDPARDVEPREVSIVEVGSEPAAVRDRR